MTAHKKRSDAVVVGQYVQAGARAYINFDNAASTPALQEVSDAVQAFLPWYSSVHRGAGLKSRVSTRAYEDAHRIALQFVGAQPNEHTVIFGKNTTEAINKVAYRIGLKRDDVVITSLLEHHSNDLPWRRATVRRIRLSNDGSINMAHLERLLARYAGRVKLVAVSGASNVTGFLPDIHAIAKLAHAAGAHILVDAAQLAAHRPIYMGRLAEDDHLDYVALSAHKMYAPFGTGALIGRRDTFSQGPPEYSGGGTVDFVTTTTVDWARTPDRDEAGSPNVVGAVAMAKAMKVLHEVGFPAVVAHERMLTKYALRELRRVPGLQFYGSSDPAHTWRRSGVICFNINNLPHALVAAILSYEYSIGVRNGCFCAHPYVMRLLGIPKHERLIIRDAIVRGDRSNTPGMVRVSFGMYNTKEEVDALVKALQAIAKGEHGDYTLDPRAGIYKPKTAPDDTAYFTL